MRRTVRVTLLLTPTFAFVALAAVYLWQNWGRLPADGPRGSARGGRLVVVAVFDQMRGDYPERWAALYGRDGFERLKRDGVFYRNAHLPYSCSSTGPGHASIGTGVPPSVHGIIENKWYDRKRAVEALSISGDRPYTRVPASPAATEWGFSPDQLLVEGIGDHLKKVHPESRVFSLSLKDRSAALTGGKRPDGVYCFDTAAGQFHTTSYYRDRLPEWVRRFNDSNAADQWFKSRWDRLRDEAVYTAAVGPDDAPGETRFERDVKTGGLVGYGPTFPHAMNIDGQPHPNVRYYDRVENSPFGNELLWQFAKACIGAEKLGASGHPDLLFLSFSSNDLIGHKWGPDSHEVLDVTLRVDRLLADMIAHLDEVVGAGNYTLVVTADHGICPLPEVSVKGHPEAVRFDPRPEFGPDGLGRVLNQAFGEIDPEGKGWFEFRDRDYSPHIFLNRKAIAAHGADPDAVIGYAAKWAGNRPHMLTAIPRAVLEGKPSADPLIRRAQLGHHPERCGDVYLITKPYCLVSGGTGTSHGSPHPYDTWVPVIAFGATVPKWGPRDEETSSLVVAPVVCHALGIAPPERVAERLPAGWGK